MDLFTIFGIPGDKTGVPCASSGPPRVPGTVLRGDVVRQTLGRLSAVEEHWILAAFVVIAVVSAVAVYWYMRSKMR